MSADSSIPVQPRTFTPMIFTVSRLIPLSALTEAFDKLFPGLTLLSSLPTLTSSLTSLLAALRVRIVVPEKAVALDIAGA